MKKLKRFGGRVLQLWCIAWIGIAVQQLYGGQAIWEVQAFCIGMFVLVAIGVEIGLRAGARSKTENLFEED